MKPQIWDLIGKSQYDLIKEGYTESIFFSKSCSFSSTAFKEGFKLLPFNMERQPHRLTKIEEVEEAIQTFNSIDWDIKNEDDGTINLRASLPSPILRKYPVKIVLPSSYPQKSPFTICDLNDVFRPLSCQYFDVSLQHKGWATSNKRLVEFIAYTVIWLAMHEYYEMRNEWLAKPQTTYSHGIY